jgi:hypothetical protein
MHPYALPNKSGARGMKAGDRVIYTIDGRRGGADEFLHDGDTFVTWDDGTFGNVKWNYLIPESQHPVR